MAELTNLFQFSLIIKLFVSVAMLFYFIFVVVIYRQVLLMSQILSSKISSLLKTISLIQITVVAVLFFLALIIA